MGSEMCIRDRAPAEDFAPTARDAAGGVRPGATGAESSTFGPAESSGSLAPSLPDGPSSSDCLCVAGAVDSGEAVEQAPGYWWRERKSPAPRTESIQGAEAGIDDPQPATKQTIAARAAKNLPPRHRPEPTCGSRFGVLPEACIRSSLEAPPRPSEYDVSRRATNGPLKARLLTP